jgi:hypothetical protein
MDQLELSLGEIFKAATGEKPCAEGRKVLQRLVDMPMPVVVGVGSRPAMVHSEYLLLADIPIASDRATDGGYPDPAFDAPPTAVWDELCRVTMSRPPPRICPWRPSASCLHALLAAGISPWQRVLSLAVAVVLIEHFRMFSHSTPSSSLSTSVAPAEGPNRRPTSPRVGPLSLARPTDIGFS